MYKLCASPDVNATQKSARATYYYSLGTFVSLSDGPAAPLLAALLLRVLRSTLFLSLFELLFSVAFYSLDGLPGFLDRARNVAPDYHYYRSLTSRELALICTRRSEEPGRCRRRVSRPKISP